MGPPTWHPARGQVLCPKPPISGRGCPGAITLEPVLCLVPLTPLVTATPGLSGVTRDGWDGPGMVSSFGVTSRVRASQDWAFTTLILRDGFSQSRPWPPPP